jgi:hypothetical protein
MANIRTFEVWNPMAKEYEGTITEDMSKLSKGAKRAIQLQIEAGFLREVKNAS